MPSAWNLIDTSFPTFTGKERPSEQIPVILDYMYMLSEGLKYQLNNLNAKNWNTNALEDLKIETTEDLVEQMTAVTEDISTAINRLNTLNAQLLQMEMDVGALEKQAQEQGDAIEELDERMVSTEGAIQQLEDLIAVDDSGGVTIGKAGQTVRLVGNVYINGVLVT